jgi:hypothetical protein
MMETQAKVLKHTTGTLLKLLSIILFPVASFASPVVQSWQNHTTSNEGLLLEPRISFYTTTTNFDANSQAITLLNQVTVTRLYFDLSATYHLPNDWFLFGRLSALSSKVKNPTQDIGTISGLSDQLLGIAHRVISNPNGLNLSLQFEGTLPVYQNTNQVLSGDPFLGDGSVDLTGGAFAEFPLSQGSDFWIEAGAGYTYRSKGYSSAVPYSLMLKKSPETEGLLFSIGARGQFSLQTDKTLPSIALGDQNRGAGGSYLINSVNPSWTMAQGEIGYKTSGGSEFYVLAAAPITGKNAPSGIQAALGARFDFGAHPSKQPVAQAATPSAQGSKKKLSQIDHFTTYNFETEVTSINDQFYLAKIGKGLDDGIEKGQLFDIFQVTEDTVTQRKTETPVARARVTYVKNDEAALTVVEYYRDQWIEKGYIARRVVQ